MNNDDLISRQEVLNKLNELDQQELYLPCHFKEFVLDEVPSIQLKTGQWNIDDLSGCIKCSYCDGDALIDVTSGEQLKSRWCPHCGAKMEGEHNG